VPSGKGRRSRRTIHPRFIEERVLPRTGDGLVHVVVYTEACVLRPRIPSVRKLIEHLECSLGLDFYEAVGMSRDGKQRVLFHTALVDDENWKWNLELLQREINAGPRLVIARRGNSRSGWQETSRRTPKHRGRMKEAWAY
jgi:hypothetical protein